MNTVVLDIGTFEILQIIKQKQEKSVFLARNVLTHEKVILRMQTQESQAYQLLSLVRHDHLAKVFCVQHLNGTVYIVEEYVCGKLLSDIIQEGPLAKQDVIRIGIQLCSALEALHKAGIVHRDVKPENVFLLEDGTVKLFDYDAARIYKIYASSDTTPLGTIGFAAPEQFGLTQSDARSDIYSLGILLNILLTGVHPTVKLCGGILRNVILRCSHVNPERRYQNVAQVYARLKLLKKRVELLVVPALAVLLTIGILAGRAVQKQPEEIVNSLAPSVTPEATLVSTVPSAMEEPSPKPMETASLQMPMGFSESIESVQKYVLDGTLYHLIISVNGNEMDEPGLISNTRHFYLPEYEIVPIYLYIVPVDGDVQKIRAFKEQVEGIRYEILSERDEENPFTLRNFAASLYSDSNMLASGELIALASDGSNEPKHRMVSGVIRMKNGDTLTLNLSMTQTPADIVLSCEQYPMETVEQLNRLLGDLEMAYGWNPNTPVTLLLPETVYTDEIVIQGRAVILQGAQNGTVFADGLRITAADDAQITLRNIAFKGDGTGAAITSARDTAVIGCSFEGYDTAWRALNGAQFTHYDSSFNVTIPPKET